MAVTYEEIAKIVGVSRGTVDRALNDRGRIDPEIKEKIRKVADELGFTPSHIGRALARAKNPVKIGVVVHLTKIPFFKRVIQGINQARTEIANLGGELLIEESPALNAEIQLKAINSLVEQGIQGLAISPIRDERLKVRLNELYEAGVPIVLFNTDMEGLKKTCYVGMDNVRAGRTSAGLMNLLLKESAGKVLIISGHDSNISNSRRVKGFAGEVKNVYPYIDITGQKFNMDNEKEAYRVVMAALTETPDIKAIYMVSSGQAGACKALEELGKAGAVKMIVHDTLPETVRYIKKGVIDFIIDQNAFEQGVRPPRILFDYLFNGKQGGPAEGENLFTDITIRTKYNI